VAIQYTPLQNLPYPDADSTIKDINDYIRNLALALEGKLVMVFPNDAARTTAVASPTEGMLSWLQDTNMLYVHDGTGWKQMYPSAPAILSGTVAPTGSTGAVGDIYIQHP